DGSPLYDAGLFKSSQNPIPLSPSALARPAPAPRSAGLWCVPKPAGVSDAQLEEVINFFCNQGIDCSPIKSGGACFEPNTIASHAAYVLNLHYQFVGGNPWDCDYFQTATITAVNP
ncbi:glucan endo-1,3-beta-glucosidase 7, partial [Olea europaea subsp. europaea]